jgi:DNA-binding XRE family transcriptional regulator
MVRTIRIALGLTQTQFAEALGVSQSTITHIENGRRRPSPDLALKIVRLAKQHQQPGIRMEMLYPTLD